MRLQLSNISVFPSFLYILKDLDTIQVRYLYIPFLPSPPKNHTRRLTVYLLKYPVIYLTTAKLSGVSIAKMRSRHERNIITCKQQVSTNFPNSWVFIVSKVRLSKLAKIKIFEQLSRKFPAR